MQLTLQAACQFCFHAHGDQRYGNDSCEPSLCRTHPFAYHLRMMQAIAKRHGIMDRSLRIGLFGHDLLEDTKVTIEELFKAGFSSYEVSLIDACTDGEGETRDEKKAVAYAKIRQVRHADTVKVIDRIANAFHTLTCGSSRYLMYKEEQAGFRKAIFDRQNKLAQPLWAELEWLFSREAQRQLRFTHRCSTPRAEKMIPQPFRG